MKPTVADLLRDHVSLSINCIDRLYINGYVPSLQTPGGLCSFLRTRRSAKIPSPALFNHMRESLIKDIKGFAEEHDIPVVRFERGQRKDDIAATYRAKFESEEGVVLIGTAQERAMSFKGSKRKSPEGFVDFDFSRQPVYVNQFYFYLRDKEWGPAFIKVCSYLPFAIKLCLNGHEWAKQQLRHEGIAFESLDNGFLHCDHPEQLQQICDDLGPEAVLRFFHHWAGKKIPWPLTKEDREAGHEHRLSIWQMETSLTQVFDRPDQGRHFFEAVIRENIDLGRPDRVSLLFPTRYTCRTPAPRRGYRTRVITSGVHPSLHVEYKSSHVKQYFKEERALRTETTINDTGDFGIGKDISHLDELRQLGHSINRKLLDVERVGQDCVLSQDELDSIQSPTVEQGQRAPALAFGNRRVLSLMLSLCLLLHLPSGFRNRDLRMHVATLLGIGPEEYRAGQMTYDLRRLRLKGLIERCGEGYRYRVTGLGLRVALFYSKVHQRILRPGFAALADDDDDDELPRPLKAAFAHVEREIERLCSNARLEAAGDS